MKLPSILSFLVIIYGLNSCSNKPEKSETTQSAETTYASELIPFFDHWNLILGDGSNAGQAVDFEQTNFFYAADDENGDWVVFKAPNSGDTH